MSASLILHRLQKVDSRIDRVNARLTAIRRSLGDDAEMREALTRLEKAKEEQHAFERILKQSEAEAQDQQTKIQQTESSLYGGSVKNPKELQDLQHEMAALKRHLAALEEQELTAMQNVETSQAALQEAAREVEQVKARLGVEQIKLVEEQATLSKEIERLSSERQAIVSALAGQMLEMYENLRQQKRGVAIAEISDSACAACGTTLTAALQQSARSSTLTHCPSCGRILYAG